MAAGDELEAMQALARRCWREAPTRLDLAVAELAYEAGIGAAAGLPLRLWREDGRCRGWGRVAALPRSSGRSSPARRRSSTRSSTGSSGRRSPAPSCGRPPGTAMRRRGRRSPGAASSPSPAGPSCCSCGARSTASRRPRFPRGHRVRTVFDHGGDLAKRVAVHRRAWAEPGTRVAPDTYPGVTATPPYRADLDLVLEAADGTPAAFALAWCDEETRVGEFEPVGVDPAFRGRGLGRALLLDGLQRLRAAGAEVALVGARGDEGHPAPRRLCASIGFRELSRQLPFVRYGRA